MCHQQIAREVETLVDKKEINDFVKSSAIGISQRDFLENNFPRKSTNIIGICAPSFNFNTVVSFPGCRSTQKLRAVHIEGFKKHTTGRKARHMVRCKLLLRVVGQQMNGQIDIYGLLCTRFQGQNLDERAGGRAPDDDAIFILLIRRRRRKRRILH